jgi:hypothetical protein
MPQATSLEPQRLKVPVPQATSLRLPKRLKVPQATSPQVASAPQLDFFPPKVFMDSRPRRPSCAMKVISVSAIPSIATLNWLKRSKVPQATSLQFAQEVVSASSHPSAFAQGVERASGHLSAFA